VEKIRQRTVRFLLGRGFSLDKAVKAVKPLLPHEVTREDE